MPIEYSDLKVFLAATNNDTSSNGGAMGATQAISGLPGQIWPTVNKAERDAGSTKYRKIFHKNDNAGDIALQNGRLSLFSPPPGDAELYLFAATHTDTQAAITGSEALYGVGVLDTGVSAGATAIDVVVKDPAVIIFRDGEMIRISDMTDDLDETGNEEFVLIDGTPSIAGDVVTISLATPLVNAYGTDPATHVASVIEHGTVAPAITGLTVTSTGGALNSANLKAHNKGTVQQSWTLTFTSATVFNAVGSVVGSVGSGNISSNFAPINPATGTPYFTLQYVGLSGAFVAGDTITFTTSPSAVPVWEKRVVPAGAANSSGNSANTYLWGETP